jgi:hypothetical protein
MSEIDWKNGGDNPLLKPAVCAECGEIIASGTKDYLYGKDGAYWVRAHTSCIEKKDPGAVSSELLDALYRIAEAVERIANQGAKQ